MIYELRDRGKEKSLWYHQKWKGCGRRAVISQALYDADENEGSFIGSLSGASAIGTLVHAYIELHFRGYDVANEPVEFTAPRLEQLPTWAQCSEEYVKARDIGLWFAQKFSPRLFGEILSIDQALSLGGDSLIRHNDIVFRLNEAEAAELGQVTETIWLPGLHAVDWKTTDYAKRGERYGDALDSASYRELARVNFARHNEPVYFTYFLIPYSKAKVAKPEAIPVPMGTEDKPGMDRKRIEWMIKEGEIMRRAALELHPDGLPDVSKCRDIYGKTCPHYLTRCNRIP
jgi:hypothetical protein